MFQVKRDVYRVSIFWYRRRAIRTHAESKHSALTFVFNRTGNERFGAVLCGNTRENSREIHVFTIVYHADTRSFSPGILFYEALYK